MIEGDAHDHDHGPHLCTCFWNRTPEEYERREVLRREAELAAFRERRAKRAAELQLGLYRRDT